MKKKLFSIALVICLVASALLCIPAVAAVTEPAETEVVLYAVDYGVSASATDNAEAIQKVIAAAKEIENPVTIKFPEGVINIYPDKAEQRLLYASNTTGTSYGTKTIGILLEDMDNVTLDGNGCTFLYHGKMTTVAAINCTNITLTNCTIDFAVPTTIDVTVESVSGKSIIVDVPACYNYTINGTSITWTSDTSPYTGETYWSDTNYIYSIQEYNTITGTNKRVTYSIFDNVSSIQDLGTTTSNGSHRLQFNYRTVNSSIQAGICYQMRAWTRDEVGMIFWKCDEVTLSDLNVLYLHGFGIEGQTSANITFTGCTFAPPTETGRTTACYADFIHMSGCQGQIKVTDCSFSNPQDDPINVHGTFLKVISISGNQVTVEYQHSETAGFPNYFVGDQVEFVNASTLISTGDALTITDVSSPTGDTSASGSGTGSLSKIVLTLDGEIPSGVTAGSYVLENVTYTPSLLVEDCYFKSSPTRGILVTTRQEVIIRNNTFENTNMAAIYISDDANEWYESGAVRNVTITGNTFTNCGGSYAVIYIQPTSYGSEQIHQNISITNNTFVVAGNQALNAISVSGLTFTGNTISAATGYSVPSSWYTTTSCANVTISNNTISNNTVSGNTTSSKTVQYSAMRRTGN